MGSGGFEIDERSVTECPPRPPRQLRVHQLVKLKYFIVSTVQSKKCAPPSPGHTALATTTLCAPPHTSAMSAVLTHCVLTARFVPHLSPPLPSPSSPTPRLLPHHCCAMAGSCWLRGGDQATGKSSLGVWRSPASHPHRAPLPTTAPPSAPPPLPPPPVPPPSPLMPFPGPPHRAGRHSGRCHLHRHQSRPRSPRLALPLSDCAWSSVSTLWARTRPR